MRDTMHTTIDRWFWLVAFFLASDVVTLLVRHP